MSNLSVVLSALAHLPSVTEAHGYMSYPKSRDILAKEQGTDWTPQEGIWRGGDSDTSCGKHPNPNTVTSITGSTFDMEITFTANHGGNHHLNFKCEGGQWEWLERADQNGSNADTPCEFYYKSGVNGKVKSKWKSPAPCARGILRWSWETSNTCRPINKIKERCGSISPGDYTKLTGSTSDLCRGTEMERYINCADVSFGGGSQGGASAPQQPTQYPQQPTQQPTQYPQQPAPYPQQPTQYPDQEQYPPSDLESPSDQAPYPQQPGSSEGRECPGWVSSCGLDVVKEKCPITCGGSGSGPQAPNVPQQPTQYPQQPAPNQYPQQPEPTQYPDQGQYPPSNQAPYPQQPGSSEGRECPGWVSACGLDVVKEKCPITCGRRLEFDADELVSLNPSMRGNSQ